MARDATEAEVLAYLREKHSDHGAALPDREGVLLGDGSQTRFLRIHEPSAETEERISAYVQQAIAERLLR